MALNKKKSRKITVDDLGFRWVFFENSGWNDLTVQSDTGTGRKLVVRFPWEPKANSKLAYEPMTPAMVADAVRFGIVNGWFPNASGQPFICKYEDEKFSVFER